VIGADSGKKRSNKIAQNRNVKASE